MSSGAQFVPAQIGLGHETRKVERFGLDTCRDYENQAASERGRVNSKRGICVQDLVVQIVLGTWSKVSCQ